MPTTTYHVRLNERVLQVQVRTTADGVFVRVDSGAELPADLRQVRGALHSLRIADKQIEVLGDVRDHASARLAMGGREFALEVVDEAHARLAAVAGARGGGHARLELKAPMPGMLVRVLCAEGDEVQPNQPLAVLQAMKMENELALPRGGKVASIKVEADQTVEQGQVLVVLE